MGRTSLARAILPVRPVLLLALTMSLPLAAGCTGMADQSLSVKHGPAAAPTTTLPATAFRPSDPLLAALRGGGHVLVMLPTRSSGRDRDLSDLGNCGDQRELTADGRAQAQEIGAAVRRLAVPVDSVLASPLCRTRDTAWLAFDRVQGSTALAPPDGRDAAARGRAGARLRALAGRSPHPGFNTVLVTHEATVMAAFGITPGDGETLVYRPIPGRRPRLVGRILADGWTRLAGRDGTAAGPPSGVVVREYALPKGTRPSDVAPAPRGTAVWFAAPGTGQLGRLDPGRGGTEFIDLGVGARPTRVVVAPDGSPWVADAGRNALVRVDPTTRRLQRFPLPRSRAPADLGALAFDRQGTLWFTGRRGMIGRLDVRSGGMEVFDSPRGPGPEGIATTAGGEVYYASGAGGYLGRVDVETGATEVIEPPTPAQGMSRLAVDPRGRLWLSEQRAGRIAVFDPAARGWREWRLPGAGSRPVGLWLDAAGTVWVSDPGAGAVVAFDPLTERFTSVPLPVRDADAGELRGRRDQLWVAAAGADRLVAVLRR
ncbi:MAG TPA: histidine phosphatase family protein [Actinomycetes bacterium]|nr:histidine phosphatase family protein [Actinomycetes bacterium]